MSGQLPPSATWHVYTFAGRRFGPLTRAELDRWAAEGRLTPQCQVYQEGWPAWKFAPEVFPSLAAAEHASDSASARRNPYASPAAAVSSSPLTAVAYKVPHRATLILVLGILSITACVFCGPFAWSMGRRDLRAMAQGRMQTDNSGQGLTQAGMIMGIVGTVLMFVNLLLVAAYVGLIIALNA
jgi:hypothetical protein